MINSTWAEALGLCGSACGTTTQYPNARSAPASVQTAAFNALVNQNGLSDYTCPGCDPALVNAINGAGGLSAFQLSGLSTDPAQFAALDTADAGTPLSNLLSTTADGTPMTTTVSPDGTVVIATPGSSATVSTLSNFFEWLDAQITTTIDQVTDALISQIQGALDGIVPALAVIAAFALALTYWDGHISLRTLIFFLLSLGVVASATSSNGLYQQWVIFPAENLPTWWEGVFTNISNTAPAALFDNVYNKIYALEKQIIQAAPVSTLSVNSLWLALKISVADAVLQVAEWGMYIPFVATKLVIRIALVLGPVCIPFILFESTKGITSGWVRVILSALGSLLVADILLLIYSGIIKQALQTLTVTGTPDNDILGFGGFVGVALFFGFVAFFIPGVTAWRIFGAAGVAVPAAQRLMSGLIFKDAVKAAV